MNKVNDQHEHKEIAKTKTNNLNARVNTYARGLTLIELLFSLGIFAVVFLTSMYVLLISQKVSEESRGRLLAMNTARSVLETVKSTSLANVPNINVASFVPSGLPGGAITITTSSATGNLNVDPIATVTINVSWKGPKNMTKNLQLTTMRSRY